MSHVTFRTAEEELRSSVITSRLSSAVKRTRSDDENSDSDVDSVGPDKSLAAKLKELGSDSSSEDEERSKEAAGKKDEKALFGSDSDSGDEEE